mgnify:CR=1 FL=1
MIGKILKTMRKEKGLSQDQIGKYVGKKENTISQWEKGVIEKIDFKDIEIIAELCDYEIIFKNKKANNELTTKNIDRKEI